MGRQKQGQLPARLLRAQHDVHRTPGGYGTGGFSAPLGVFSPVINGRSEGLIQHHLSSIKLKIPLRYDDKPAVPSVLFTLPTWLRRGGGVVGESGIPQTERENAFSIGIHVAVCRMPGYQAQKESPLEAMVGRQRHEAMGLLQQKVYLFFAKIEGLAMTLDYFLIFKAF